MKNENDNVPVFKQKIYTFTAPLATRRFTAVGQVTAEDADGDPVVYRLTRPPGPFVVVPQTGEIILTESPQVRYTLSSFISLYVREAAKGHFKNLAEHEIFNKIPVILLFLAIFSNIRFLIMKKPVLKFHFIKQPL